MIRFIKNIINKISDDFSVFLYKNLNNSYRINTLRKMGARIGERCRIHCVSISPESYLIDIGNDVIIAQGSKLITHEGSICIFHKENPNLDLFGTIKIGNNCFIGMSCFILPNTNIGNNCIIGAGSVVRGRIPDNSVVIGNPAKVIMTTEAYKNRVFANPVLHEYKNMSDKDKRKILLERFGVLKKTSNLYA